jgi:hypothetical protein
MDKLNKCVIACKSDESCVKNCRSANVCGATNPDLSNSTTNGTLPTATPDKTTGINATYDEGAAASLLLTGNGFETLGYGLLVSAITVMVSFNSL